jgi:hypothetical protein
MRWCKPCTANGEVGVVCLGIRLPPCSNVPCATATHHTKHSRYRRLNASRTYSPCPRGIVRRPRCAPRHSGPAVSRWAAGALGCTVPARRGPCNGGRSPVAAAARPQACWSACCCSGEPPGLVQAPHPDSTRTTRIDTQRMPVTGWPAPLRVGREPRCPAQKLPLRCPSCPRRSHPTDQVPCRARPGRPRHPAPPSSTRSLRLRAYWPCPRRRPVWELRCVVRPRGPTRPALWRFPGPSGAGQ